MEKLRKRRRRNSFHYSLDVEVSRMSVSDTDLIDFVSEKDGRVTLSVADHLTWDEEGAHLVQLQDKLNRYCDFINSGELADKFPKLADARPLIRVHFVHAPSSAAERFLSLA